MESTFPLKSAFARGAAFYDRQLDRFIQVPFCSRNEIISKALCRPAFYPLCPGWKFPRIHFPRKSASAAFNIEAFVASASLLFVDLTMYQTTPCYLLSVQ